MRRKIGSRVVRWLVVAVMCMLPVQVFAQYANVVVVAKSGGDFDDPVAALNSITNASASNPYLLKIMPGVYELASTAASRLHLKSYVDIEGSGKGVTKIKGTTWNFDGVVVASNTNNTEIRNISIEALAYPGTPGTGNVVAISNTSGSFSLSNVSIAANAGVNGYAYIYTSNGSGELVRFSHATMSLSGTYSYGIKTLTCNPLGNKTILDNSIISVSGVYAEGVSSCYDAYEINNSTITATGTVLSRGVRIAWDTPLLTIKGSTINAASYAVGFGSGSVGIANTQVISNTVISSTAHAKCIGLYDANLIPVICP